jgi:hypothetical protein
LRQRVQREGKYRSKRYIPRVARFEKRFVIERRATDRHPENEVKLNSEKKTEDRQRENDLLILNFELTGSKKMEGLQ